MFTSVLLVVALFIVGAGLGRTLARMLGQPSVLGELLLGVLCGNVGYFLDVPIATLLMHFDSTSQVFENVWLSGNSVSEAARTVFDGSELEAGGIGEKIISHLSSTNGPTYLGIGFSVWAFSNLGVIFLLFMVGLRNNTRGILEQGWRAGMVALVGVVIPFAAGFAASLVIVPEAPLAVPLFLGAALSATSVGITARVFEDLGKLDTAEAKLILGAAVIDDVLGLLILAGLVGTITTGSVSSGEIAKLLFFSILLLATIVLVGERISRSIARFGIRAGRSGFKLLFPVAMAFLLSWVAESIGLAAIIGAFGAGLMINESHFSGHAESRSLEDLLAPLETVFAPLFFFLMGMQVHLPAFAEQGTLLLALALSVVAIVGKLTSGYFAGKTLDRMIVGIAMIPRGEVGLIFASIGRSIGVLNQQTFSALIIMIVITTFLAPAWLDRSIRAKEPSLIS